MFPRRRAKKKKWIVQRRAILLFKTLSGHYLAEMDRHFSVRLPTTECKHSGSSFLPYSAYSRRGAYRFVHTKRRAQHASGSGSVPSVVVGLSSAVASGSATTPWLSRLFTLFGRSRFFCWRWSLIFFWASLLPWQE